MQQFAFKRTEEGIRKRQEAIWRGQAEAHLQRQRDAKVKEIEDTIAALQKQLQKLKEEPLLIKSEFRKIEERASRIFGVPIAALKGNRRHRKLIMARQFVMYWARPYDGHVGPGRISHEARENGPDITGR
jgi:chromosomal replication initiation ATPase DnaA